MLFGGLEVFWWFLMVLIDVDGVDGFWLFFYVFDLVCEVFLDGIFMCLMVFDGLWMPLGGSWWWSTTFDGFWRVLMIFDVEWFSMFCDGFWMFLMGFDVFVYFYCFWVAFAFMLFCCFLMFFFLFLSCFCVLMLFGDFWCFCALLWFFCCFWWVLGGFWLFS